VAKETAVITMAELSRTEGKLHDCEPGRQISSAVFRTAGQFAAFDARYATGQTYGAAGGAGQP
jgi:hypothetical protein